MVRRHRVQELQALRGRVDREGDLDETRRVCIRDGVPLLHSDRDLDTLAESSEPTAVAA